MLTSENDSEIEIILSESSEIPLTTNDKPLSPILNSSNLNRKLLFGKRSIHKKSRRKLIDKFENVNSIPTTSIEKKIDSQLHNFAEDSFSLSQSDDLMNCLDRLEEIEKNRDHVYKLLVDNKKNDFCFKKPISPAPNKTKKIKHDVLCSKEMKSGNVINENVFDDTFPVPRDIPKLSGFQTATGKQLSISEELFKKHEKIFEDILTPSQQPDNRKNKYNFLSKTKCCSSDRDNGNQRYIMPASSKEHLENLGLTTETVDDKEIITSGSDKMISEVQESISLTQEIWNSEISNSQILFAADQALGKIHIKNDNINLSNPNAEFRGFNFEEILKSATIYQQLTKIHNDISYFKKLNGSVASKDITPVSGIAEHQVSGLRKHTLDNLDSPPTKRLKQEITLPEIVFKKQRPEWKENILPPLENYSSISPKGFSSASGKSIAISSNSMKRAKHILDEIESEMIQDKKSKCFEENKDIIGHESLNNNSFPSQEMLKNDHKREHEEMKDILKENNSSVENTAGENPNVLSLNKNTKLKIIDQSDVSLKSGGATKSRALYSVKDKLKFFDAMIENDLNFISTKNPSNGFSTASGNALKPSQKFLKFGESIFADVDKNTSIKSIQQDGLSKLTAQADAKNKLKIMDEAIRFAESKKDNKAEQLNFSPLSFGKSTGLPSGFVSAARKPFCVSEASKKASYTDFDGIQSHSTPTRSNLDEKSFYDNRRQVSKKKLGVTSCKQIPISETKLNRAKQLFQEEFLDMSPIRPVQQSVIQTSTPLRHSYCATPVRNTNSRPSKNSLLDLDISESTVMEAVEEKEEELLLGDDLLVIFSETGRGNDSNLLSDLEDERKRLEKRLKVITERQDALADLKKEKLDIDKKPRLGVMYQVKLRGNKVPIISFVDGKKPGETCMRDLFCISPQNAENIHFKECASKISTKDCAIVVPNTNDLIGLPEIDFALRTMPGVEARLIPKGWIRNHYKWIIWKLASYERMFPLHFTHVLNVEHVVQQLKYRYDREIDKAERPALRKIYEKDDAPQKRIVLCVSNIKKVDSDKFELELTDGWYRIRTVIDEPLCHQIQKQKIKIGTKLITCGAELMNCDGCSPLEATDLTYLKVNFNCTRRAIWNTRLGYQRFSGPFPIQIHSVHPLGGPIGAIQITIARIYPTKYLEKLESQSVWRNKRAEERRAQEWEVERCRKMEQIENDLRREFSSCLNKGPSNFKRADIVSDISKISCPETLLSILENNNDPDSLQERLSSIQRLAVVEYKRNLFQQKQQEMSSKIKQNAEKLKMLTRDVVPLLKMLVVDINGSPTRAFNFTVWHPTESHYQILREGTSVSAYNVLPKMNGDLSCSSKTIFKPESPKEPISEIFKRKVMGIGDLSDLKFSVNFSEFDTVGLVIQLKIGVKFQEVWLADSSGRLLLISIYEGPSTCLLLDNLKRSQAVTVCNLRFRNLTDDISQAIGNHFTVFSPYSQHKHLREYLENFKRTMPKCCDKLLEDCDNKIERFRCKTPRDNLDESDEDTLVSSRITSTDLALSLIDMDKYT